MTGREAGTPSPVSVGRRGEDACWHEQRRLLRLAFALRSWQDSGTGSMGPVGPRVYGPKALCAHQRAA
jgi:hypothetical protein